MNTRPTTTRMQPERGFILATVLVFLVVLSLTAFLAAKLTRTDIQVVNNLQNQKEALAIAEAGIHEALYRMSVAIGDTSTVNGQTFNASLAPIVPGRAAPVGVTSYGIASATPASTSQVIFTTSGVPATGTNNVVPTLQPASLQLPYSLGTADTAPVDLGSTANLTVGWDVCAGPAPSIGCNTANSFYPIRGLPISSPRPVAKIVSTGRSGTATQKISAWAVDCIPSQTPGEGAIVALDQGCPGGTGGAQLNGRNTITTSGHVQVNAGATYNPPSSCNAASTGGAQSFIHGGSINVSGNIGGNGNFTPAPTTGSLPLADPYSGLVPPCYTGGPAPCQGSPAVTTVRNGSAASPSTYTVNTPGATIQPGIYYGGIDITSNNVTMASGYYIIAGGGLTVGNNASVSSAAGGVMIFNTLDAANPNGQGAAGSLSLNNGNTSPNFTAISNTSDPFYGVVFFQERAPTLPLAQQPDLYIQGGGVGRALDGLVYAPDAFMHVQGSNVVNLGGALIVRAMDFAGSSGLNVQNSNTGLPGAACGGLAYQIIGWQDF
jgi:hypothetical protein